eukprot:1138859-Pelagomonas_calceolata.AAC.12
MPDELPEGVNRGLRTGVFLHAPCIGFPQLALLKLGFFVKPVALPVALGFHKCQLGHTCRGVNPTFLPLNLHSRPPTASKWVILSDSESSNQRDITAKGME